MKKMVLIDGTNLLFRSYYATAMQNRLMRNSLGMPTNALFGFVNMINKIVNEENADIYVVAFDEGKTFRHRIYDGYKSKRSKSPDELTVQLPYAKDILNGLGITWIIEADYEADDIVGSLAMQYQNQFDIVAISSDQDYLQLVSDNVIVKLLKKEGFILYNKEQLLEDYGLVPKQIIDLKAIEGDKSDNIPGVSGIGRVGALKLIKEYNSLENIYANIANIPGKVKDKLLADQENAFFSKELATIYTDLRYELADLAYSGITDETLPLLIDIYTKLEFNNFLSTIQNKPTVELTFKSLTNLDLVSDDCFLYPEFFGEDLHNLQLLGIGISKDNQLYYYAHNNDQELEKLFAIKLKVYDYKKLNYYLYTRFNKHLTCTFDLVIANYLLNKRSSSLANHGITKGINIILDKDLYGTKSKAKVPSLDVLSMQAISKVYLLSDLYASTIEELIDYDLLALYEEVELNLVKVLTAMEYDGVSIDVEVLNAMNTEFLEQLSVLENQIYELAGGKFNINSYQQLGEVLFAKLQIPYPKKKKDDEKYKTNIDILNKLSEHEIVSLILQYRTLKKLVGTYLEGLIQHVEADSKIHTVFNQTLTETGRLSSNNPNLQNIPIRTDIGRKIRKAFIPSSGNLLLACDYSQIELRVLAHLSNSKEMIDAFNSNEDIHSLTAAKIYGIDQSMIDDNMRRNAKAVNFGIIYGMSDFGLSQALKIPVSEAKQFIDKYFAVYAGIKEYLDKLIKDATENGYSKTMFNRIRFIEELNSTNFMQRQLGERLAMNTPIQGSAADIIKIAMLKIYEEFRTLNLESKMVLQVHDELIFDCVKTEQEQVLEIVLRNMENAFNYKSFENDFKLKLEVSHNFGKDWFSSK